MELFNSLFHDTRALLEKGSPTVWDYDPAAVWKDIGSSELVLQKDAAFELGASGKGSANYVLFTSSPELVDRDRVLLYGPDLKEIRGDTDFARIVLLRVGVLFVVYFWNLDQKVLGWAYKQVNTMFDRKKVDLVF